MQKMFETKAQKVIWVLYIIWCLVYINAWEEAQQEVICTRTGNCSEFLPRFIVFSIAAIVLVFIFSKNNKTDKKK